MIEKELDSQDSEIRPITKGSTVTTFHETRRPHRLYFSSKKNKSSYSSTVYSSQSPVRNRQVQKKSISPSPGRKVLYWQNWLLPQQLRETTKIMTPILTSKSICAQFTDDDKLFIAQNCDQRMQVASLTKIMTAFTVICICNSYGIKIRDTWVMIEKQASMMEGTSANLRNGEQLLVIDLLYGLMLPSGNDAAIALSQYFGNYLSFQFASEKNYEGIGGNQQQYSSQFQQFQALQGFYNTQYKDQSIKLFVFEMNKNCHKMNLKNTNFNNPTGLTDQKNYSTAQDIVKLINFCMKNHLLRSIFKKKNYACEAKNQKFASVRKIEWKNTNKHLFSIKDCVGIKTGITPGAGPCLSTAYRIMGRQLIVVVLNSKSLDDRYLDSENIYRYARATLQNH